ncbi:MAG: hypothetical protein V1823_02315 [Chloroflexota bacterium]
MPADIKGLAHHPKTEDSQRVIEYFELVAQINNRRTELASVKAGVQANKAAAIEAEIARLTGRRKALTPEVEARL